MFILWIPIGSIIGFALKFCCIKSVSEKAKIALAKFYWTGAIAFLNDNLFVVLLVCFITVANNSDKSLLSYGFAVCMLVVCLAGMILYLFTFWNHYENLVKRDSQAFKKYGESLEDLNICTGNEVKYDRLRMTEG